MIFQQQDIPWFLALKPLKHWFWLSCTLSYPFCSYKYLTHPSPYPFLVPRRTQPPFFLFELEYPPFLFSNYPHPFRQHSSPSVLFQQGAFSLGPAGLLSSGTLAPTILQSAGRLHVVHPPHALHPPLAEGEGRPEATHFPPAGENQIWKQCGCSWQLVGSVIVCYESP